MGGTGKNSKPRKRRAEQWDIDEVSGKRRDSIVLFCHCHANVAHAAVLIYAFAADLTIMKKEKKGFRKSAFCEIGTVSCDYVTLCKVKCEPMAPINWSINQRTNWSTDQLIYWSVINWSTNQLINSQTGRDVLRPYAWPVRVWGTFRSLLEAGDGSHCLDGRLVQSDGHSLTTTAQSGEQASRSEGRTTTTTAVEKLPPWRHVKNILLLLPVTMSWFWHEQCGIFSLQPVVMAASTLLTASL